MPAKKEKDLFINYERIEELRTEFLRELTSLSKIFIPLAIAFLALTMAQSGPELSKKAGILWIVASWSTLLISVAFGSIQIFLFSRRYKMHADYLYSSHIVDLSLHLNFPKERFEDFYRESEIHREKYEREYSRCILFFNFQAITLFLAFVFFGIFVFKNFS